LTITDRSRAPRINSSMFLDIPRPPPTFRSPRFLNRLCLNRLNVPHVSGELFECVICDRINPHLLQLTFWMCYFSPRSASSVCLMSQLTFWMDYFSMGSM
jgi:hypothetical protein